MSKETFELVAGLISIAFLIGFGYSVTRRDPWTGGT